MLLPFTHNSTCLNTESFHSRAGGSNLSISTPTIWPYMHVSSNDVIRPGLFPVGEEGHCCGTTDCMKLLLHDMKAASAQPDSRCWTSAKRSFPVRCHQPQMGLNGVDVAGNTNRTTACCNHLDRCWMPPQLCSAALVVCAYAFNLTQPTETNSWLQVVT